MTQVCRHILISGRVQGVCFRHFTRQAALKNGVCGWVRNLSDGRVEGVFAGEKAAVDATINWCHQGPEAARVDRIEIEELEANREFEGFKIR